MKPLAISRAERRNAELIGENDRLRERINNLLNANNAEVERRRTAERALSEAQALITSLGDGLLSLIAITARLKGRAERAERVIHTILRATPRPLVLNNQKLSEFGEVGHHAAK